ncbi:MAG TPA: energy transducer TonB [Candidatus Angelobacter sp.]|nr:energy transducer TonB [Candidatus Angelobacter sp.]
MTVPRFNYELPSARRKDTFVWSVGLHAVGVVALVAAFKWLPSPHIEHSQTQLTPVYAPTLENPPVQKIVPPPPKVLAKLTPPKITVPLPDVPKVEPKLEPLQFTKVPEPVPPKPEPKKEVVTGTFATNNDVVTPVKPKKEVVTESFASGSSAPATLQKPAHEVQTGGFGDPNGVKGTSDKKGAITVARLGSFDLPAGPGTGNGTGGAHGARGTIASTGFGSGVAGPGQGERGRTGSVVQAGFSEVAATIPVQKVRTEEKPNVTPVEIIYKPIPVYTQEARQIHLEGEVLVRVTFGAAGDLRVEQVVRGLGHGLDESALRAAQQIRFRPARRNGQPYDSTALVHIVFELAN